MRRQFSEEIHFQITSSLKSINKFRCAKVMKAETIAPRYDAKCDLKENWNFFSNFFKTRLKYVYLVLTRE
jgi:hypothetical protein